MGFADPAQAVLGLGIGAGMKVVLAGVPTRFHRAVRDAVGARGALLFGLPTHRRGKPPAAAWVWIEDKTQAAIRLPAYLDAFARGGRLWIAIRKRHSAEGPTFGARLTEMDLSAFLASRGWSPAARVDLGDEHCAYRCVRAPRPARAGLRRR